MAAAAAAPVRALERLLCRTTASLFAQLPAGSRLAALDVTPTHVSIALCDRDRSAAAPFGVLARTSQPRADALIIASALRKAAEYDAAGRLDVGALVIGVAPDARDGADSDANAYGGAPAYTRELLLADLGEGGALFPGLAGVLFYSEAHALRRAVRSQIDYVQSIKQLPTKLESRKRKRFATAMDPVVPYEELVTDATSRARVTASEILQAVLDDFKHGNANESPLPPPPR